MFLSTSTIDDKTINLLFTRIITNHNSLQKHGSIALSEFNIDEITSLSNEENIFYPTRILKDLIPFMVEIINADDVIKAVYTFSIYLHTKDENPYDIQYYKKSIEVEITTQEEKLHIGDTIADMVDDMPDISSFFSTPTVPPIDNSNNKKLVLSVTRLQLLDEIRREKLNIIRSFKDDKCIICLSSNSTILFCDCGHTCICEDCFILLDENKCPKCRTNNKTIRKI